MDKLWAHTSRQVLRSLSRWCVLLSLCFACVGCDTGPKLHPVSGTVSVKGKPIDAGRIIFEPVGEGVSAVGDIGAGGEFELFTEVEGDGVAPGTYYPVIMDPKNDDRAKKKRLGVVQMETTKFEVTAEGPNEFDINIDGKDLEYAVGDD